MKYIDDLLFVVGILFLALGVFMIYLPAGFITLGACFTACAYFYAKRR